MRRANAVLSEQRVKELEDLAFSMLSRYTSITPHRLANEAGTDWFFARDILSSLVKTGRVTAKKSGRFALAPQSVLDGI